MFRKTAKKHGLLILFLITIQSVYADTSLSQISQCHPKIDNTLPQYIIGYGSLMQEASKHEDDATAGENFPIYLQGFERSWIEKGRPIGFSTTYLGIRKNPQAKINAVYFKASNGDAVYNYDRRESGYCRVLVSTKALQFLADKIPENGQFWIYVPTKASKCKVSVSYPIVQSYVDIFLSGCFELEKKYHLSNFAKDCVKTTTNWSKHWVNDRLYPRTAADNHPYIYDIDTLIKQELPTYFKAIRIE
jgi:hypothetical protein